jgi:sugar phosphate isomerase/epimerase
MYVPDWSVVCALADANDWAEKLGDSVGITIDTYHTWWDPNLLIEVARAGKNGKLIAFHVSDWLVPTNDLLLDRGLPGKGVIDIAAIRQHMESAGFQGWVEVEKTSPNCSVKSDLL